MRITYVGHATVQLEAGGARVLTDPILRARVVHLRRIVPLPPLEPLLDPDVVLISHAHHDHLDLPSLRRLRGSRVVAPRGCGRLVSRAGIRDVSEIAPGQELDLGLTSIRAVRLAHDGRRHPLSTARETIGYIIDADVRTLFAGDTGLFEEMSALAGHVDTALLPVWGWGPRLGAGHMGPGDAATAVARMRPRLAIPIHWGTLAPPRVSWRHDPARPAQEFARALAEIAPTVEARIVSPGDSTDVGGVDASSAGDLRCG
jgi:L-ascorbate metabolism protein UlaG (beta-lactamase superfamily)